MLLFKNHTNSYPEFSFKGEVTEPAHSCRYLGVQIDSNPNFENHLNSVFEAKWLMQFVLCILEEIKYL